ncbi:signal-regulatory protein beta-2-like [Pelmatolapia mariae]|uniref:signal-regulatory protein beta-2-like n=1 Tax=Pelmatolapia mariae TaxID=158779 RepID=UPI002FE51192
MEQVSQLLCMDAKSERDISSLIHTIKIYSNDTGMSCRLEKCSQIVTKREDSLVPMKIVQLGEPATLTCALPSNKELSTLEVHWYKQSIGDELKLISTLYGTTPPQYGQEIFRSRYDAYSLVSVKTVHIGEPVTLTCALPKGLQSGEVHWYKQNHGDTLKLIMTLFKSTPPEYGPEYSKSRFKVDNDNNFSNVTILKTVQEDEGIYHCGLTEWIRTNWSGTYLFVQGNNQKQSVVVQQLIGSNPLHPGDTVTLQCSVSDSVNKCPGGLRVLWFRDRSHESHPVIYANVNTHNECEKRSDTQKACVYHFSKNVSSSDAGTYYCAVARCGEILFGNGTTLELGWQPEEDLPLQQIV